MKPADLFLQRRRIAQAARHIPPGARVLDVGCEEGALFQALGGAIGPSVGVDPALAAPVVLGPHRLLPGRFPAEIPEAGPFDVIVMLAVLEHVPPAEAPLVGEACARLLAPGGRVVITVPSPRVDDILAFLRWIRVVDAETLEEHHGFAPSDTPALFAGRGFRLSRAGRFQLGLNNLFVFEKT